jgi:hypothetical protein
MLEVIVTSSCRPTIEKTIRSFLEKASFSGGVRFIVHIDVLHREHLGRLRKFLGRMGITDVTINHAPGLPLDNQRRAVCLLFDKLSSPFFFHLEDDWVFLRPVDLDALVGLMRNHPFIDHIRLSKERIKPKAWLYHTSEDISEEVLADNAQVEIGGIALVKTHTWSFNPSLARTEVVKRFVSLPAGWYNAEQYLSRHYPEAAPRRGVYILGRIGDPPLVRDIGRNRLRQALRKTKYILGGGKYADYKF